MIPHHYSPIYFVAVSVVMVVVLAIGLKVRGFKPVRGQSIFNGDKNT
jgi:hypothetical protein